MDIPRQDLPFLIILMLIEKGIFKPDEIRKLDLIRFYGMDLDKFLEALRKEQEEKYTPVD